jgi:hypothetical protein
MPVSLHAAVEVVDVAAFRRDPAHRGTLAGWIELHRRGGWLAVGRGDFGLFTPSSDPRLAYMVYAAAVRIDGKDHWFNGRKHVAIAGPWRLWKATTTLYVTLHQGSSDKGPIVAAGVLTLGAGSLLDLLGTFQATGCTSPWQRVKAAASFFAFFAGELVRTYVTRTPLPPAPAQ